MVSKSEGVVIAGTVIGLTIALLLVAKRAHGAEPDLEPPDLEPVVTIPYDIEALKQEIQECETLFELNQYYIEIGSLFREMEISYVEYMSLYRAYEQRWWELTGEIR